MSAEPVAASSLRCLVVDDHPALLVAVTDLLDENGIEVVTAVRDGETAVQAAKREQPDCAVVDYRVPGVAGAELVRQLRDVAPEMRVAIYTADADAELVRQAFAAGAGAVVLKEAPLGDILRALESLLVGRPYVDAGLATRAFPEKPRITPREAEVLRLLAEGLSHESVGTELGIGAETVRTHLKKASERLGASNRTQAVAMALRLGLI